jgi:DNA-binding transcriptional MocR family regulator
VPEQYATIRGSSATEIAASIERAVAAGELAPGTRLPAVRTLATELDVSPTTIASALAELRRRGVVVSRPRSGTRIAERPPLRPAYTAIPTDARDLALGNPDPTLLPDLSAAVEAPTQRLYGEAPVDPGLAAVAVRALAADGIAAERVTVVSGALDGIERVLAAHLSPGDVVAVEDPGWPGVLDLVRALGLGLAPVAVDERGMRPEALEGVLRAGARAAIVTPRGHNPFGAALDAERAATLRELLRDVLVIEDDHLGPVAGVPWHSVSGLSGRWATVRSVSKWLGPDLRCAILAGDELTLARVEGRMSLGPGWVSGVLQRLTARLWSDPDVEARVEQASAVYAGRRAALIDALAGHGLQAHGRSGLNVWIPVPDEDEAVRALLAVGVSIAAGAPFRLQTPPAVRITAATVRTDESPAIASALAGAVNPPRRTRAG